MFNVCPGCGEYRVDKIILPEGPYAVCPNCGFQHKFVRLPLFILTGASGVGKTTACLGLAAKATEFVVMDSDILWRDEFNQPATDYRNYRETWLRVCKNISQAGKPVILCGAGVPAQFEQCVERRYFSNLHYLALVCEDETLASRLRNRPRWRGSSTSDYIEEHIKFNRWLIANGQNMQPPIALLNTSEITVNQSVEAVERWILSHLNGNK
jgi:adenylate kinase family enzyme